MKIATLAVSLAALALACTDAAPIDAPAASEDGGVTAEPPRVVETTVSFDENGVSAPVHFVVPPSTRSVTVVVEGEATRLHALAAFAMSDGAERVGIDTTTSQAEAMRHGYFTEQTGAMPGEHVQSMRLGTFTHVYPYAPGQAVVEGDASLRVVRDAPLGAAKVRILMAPEDGARVLHLNLVRVSASEELPEDAPFLPELRRIFRQADIDVVVDEVLNVHGTGLERIAEMTEPQETPESEGARLARAVAPKTASTALDVMIVDELPPNVRGLSLGVPGPPVPESYYYGVVVVTDTRARALARVIAHEAGHFLGLQHVVNRGASGERHDDPIPDTQDDGTNLMAEGAELTPGQAFVLSRSPLLSTN